MARLHSRTLKWLLSIMALLGGALAAVLLLSPNQPAYGQIGTARIPDMRGRWQGTMMAGCVFKNALDPNDVAQCFDNGTPTDEDIVDITAQTGRAFAGSTPDGGKVTGVLLPDGTVGMQAFGEGTLRLFITGKLELLRGKYVITGHTQMFDDLTPATDAPDMGTAYGQFVKVN